jgi:hypothetical protein
VTELVEGIFPSLHIDEYHADRLAVSKTGLCVFDEAPQLFHHQYFGGGSRPDTKALRLGRAFHAVLDGSFEESFVIGPDVKSRAEKAWKDFEATHT